SGVVRVAYYRGLVLKERGRLHAATEAIRRGLTLAESYGLDRETAALRRQLASRLQDQGLHAEALAELESAAAYHRASSRPQDRMWFAIDLGWVLGRGMVAGAIPVDWPRVDTAWQEALGLADEIQATEARASIQSNLAWLDLQQDRPKRALERMETLADDDSRVGAFVGLLRAEATLAGGDAESAAQMFTRVSDRRPSEWGWRVQHGLGRAQEALGRPEEAARAYRHAIDQLEFLGRSTGLVSTRGPYFANSNALIDDALRLAVAEGKGDEALLIVESARTRVLAELNHQLRQDAMSDDEHREWRAARDTLHRLSAEIDTQTAARSTVSSSALAAFDRKLNSLHERYRRFLDKTVTRFSPEPRPLAPVAELLRPEERVWITHRVGEGILHLLASQQTVHASWQAPRTEADGHLFLMGDKAIERFATLSPTRSVSVIPTLRVLEAPAPSSGTGAAVFADPRGDLPHARREGKAVSAKLGASLHLGPDISRRELQRALDEHEIVHFAGHVQAGETGAWNSRLELNPVETLSLADIIVSPVRARLVVVNGCYASSGDFLHRSERIGLAEALLISGAKTVLTAGGQVPDDHARRFLEQFYENGGDRNPALAFATTAKETKGSGFVLWGRP
ncbi:MAG: CHAT domain-containing protein, partial [Myxococcota bacterium]